MTRADDFDTFYAATSRRLVRQIFAMTGDLSEAEDAVQEAYIRAWRRWPRIRAYEDPEGWLRVVAYRITVNSWRKARNRLTAHRAGRHQELPGLSPDLVALVSALRKIPRLSAAPSCCITWRGCQSRRSHARRVRQPGP